MKLTVKGPFYCTCGKTEHDLSNTKCQRYTASSDPKIPRFSYEVRFMFSHKEFVYCELDTKEEAEKCADRLSYNTGAETWVTGYNVHTQEPV